MNSKLSKTWKLSFSFLVLLASLVWLSVFSFPTKNLKIIACDVGQGDAILTLHGSTQILIDGGRGNRVMECLGKYIPFWDRSIELVILTHPQADHYEGLISVFREYKVDTFMANSLDSGNEGYRVLKSEVGGRQARVINPLKGMSMGMGLIRLDILHPSREFLASNTTPLGNSLTKSEIGEFTQVLGASTTKLDPNEFSVQVLLSFKDFKALFTGDASPELSNTVAEELALSASRRVNYLKVPHHGSRNGLSENLLSILSPGVAVISDGKNNTYGHPHKETLDLLEKYKVTTYRTDEIGDIIIETDGFDIKASGSEEP